MGIPLGGQLHNESFYGAIKQPVIVDGKILFDDK